jgi:DNA-binding CsgD family transcriptional regulator
MSISAEHLSELIGLIYDCAIDPDAWQPNLETMRRDLGFHNAALSVHALPSMSLVLGVVTGPTQDFVASMPDYGDDVIALYGGLERFTRHPLEEPMVQSRVTGREALLASRWYREWGEPQGVIDGIGFHFMRDASTLGSIGMGRHVSAGEITDADLVPLRLLAPHFRRAVSINRLLKLQSVRAATFSATLDALDTAIVFVDERMQVAHANTAAADLLRTGDLMVLYQGLLRLTDPAAADELAAAVALAVRSEAELGRRGIGIPARRREGEPAVIHVLPLSGGATRTALMGHAAAALFITPATASPAVPTEALARLYDLTPAEARTMELVASGRTLAEAGEQLGIALSTVKSHLKQIFGKTGCQRQADLVTFANAFRRPN